MSVQCVHHPLWHERPVAARLLVMDDVVPIVEALLVIRRVDAIVRVAVARPGCRRVDEDMLCSVKGV